MQGKTVYIVGIGGIGNSALAQLLKHEGATVLGSDRSESPTTQMLKAAGIEVFVGHSASHVPENVDVLVYSDAVPSDNPERVRARELGAPELSYFEMLGKMAEGKRVVAISGTHGKTTTTAMLAKILIDAGEDPTVVVGSIAADLHSNFHAGKNDLFVVEACEYKNHFLVFHPEVLVITNIELDHTDFFHNLTDLQAAFAEARAQAITVVDQATYSTEVVPELLLPGEFNRENARAAKAAVHAIAPHISDEIIDTSLKTFRGTWRRFEYKGVLPGGAQLYDDYAHHPTAIEKTILAAKEKFLDKKIVVFFHPHTYTRTRDLFAEFAVALAKADEVYILPIFAAREEPIEGITNETLAIASRAKGGVVDAIQSIEEVIEKMKIYSHDTVVFTMGAGDVYKAGEAALV